MIPRTNKTLDVLLVPVAAEWWFTRREGWFPAPVGHVQLAGPYGTREHALDAARHPEWTIRCRTFPRTVLAHAQGVS